jgi:hypothetical protein
MEMKKHSYTRERHAHDSKDVDDPPRCKEAIRICPAQERSRTKASAGASREVQLLAPSLKGMARMMTWWYTAASQLR